MSDGQEVGVSIMEERPWVSGPKELLRHGLEHLRKGTDIDRRIAIISIDNAVELMIKTYLGLPPRVTGIKLSRKELQEISDSFSDLLDALEEYAGDKLVGVELADIEWYHRIRNQLYHSGGGITVEMDQVQVYASIASSLMDSLFGVKVVEPQVERAPAEEFLYKWNQFEGLIRAVVTSNQTAAKFPGAEFIAQRHSPWMSVRVLRDLGLVRERTFAGFLRLLDFRNNLVHGLERPRDQQTLDMANDLGSLIEQLKSDLKESGIEVEALGIE